MYYVLQRGCGWRGAPTVHVALLRLQHVGGHFRLCSASANGPIEIATVGIPKVHGTLQIHTIVLVPWLGVTRPLATWAKTCGCHIQDQGADSYLLQ